MVYAPQRATPLALSRDAAAFLSSLADDTADAPWMSMTTTQFWSVAGFVYSLHNYRSEWRLPGFVASMLPICFDVPDTAGRLQHKQVSPYALMSFVPEYPRASYDLEAEGVFPAFVLEVVSPSNIDRNTRDKVRAYDLLGAVEYMLFDPVEDGPSTLMGYRRDREGRFVPWEPDVRGWLWSAVLGLWLVPVGARLQAATADGTLLPLPYQEAEERQREVRARRAAEAARQAAEAARQEEAREYQAALRLAEAAREQEAQAHQEALQKVGAAREQAAYAAQTEIARLRAELDAVRRAIGAEGNS